MNDKIKPEIQKTATLIQDAFIESAPVFIGTDAVCEIINRELFTGQNTSRYFLAQDDSSHWYVVPVEKAEEWNAWCAIDEDDERAWDAPEWAQEVGGAPSCVTFTGPKIN